MESAPMILALESSCDESALALFSPAKGLVGEWVHSQIARHEAYGGVVPDLAVREHLTHMPQLLQRVEEEHGLDGVTQLAVTSGPGLAGCLALGMASAKALSLALDVPLVGVNHLRGHVFSPFITAHAEATSAEAFREQLAGWLPHLGLVVSGGNTLLVRVDEKLRLEVIAETVDDAAGEALDKGAKLLGLGYPGGPRVEKLAQGGNTKAFDFPRAFANSREARFSFSGLKTSLRYTLEKLSDTELEAQMPDFCASYQEAVVDALARKTRQMLRRGSYRSLGLSGGVANNGPLRERFAALAESARLPHFLAQRRHTGDNAGMIAFAAWLDTDGTRSREAMTLEPTWRLTD